MKTIAVIGKNFGDEGKGMAVDHFAMRAEGALVVRCNGGSQSGHTVEYKVPGGRRVVYHALSSGSFRSADTLWIDSFHPDLYKFGEEVDSFRRLAGFTPRVFAVEGVCPTVPDDVLINMALESSRGDKRHGSCGMGINECDERVKKGFGLTLNEIVRMDRSGLSRALSRIRREYVAARLEAIRGELTPAAREYLALLADENVPENAAEAILHNLRGIEILSKEALQKKLAGTGTLIFEAGQGLLLDRDRTEFAPHVTASSTGLSEPCRFLEETGFSLDEAVYVSRTYVTRHGAGALPCQREPGEIGAIERDLTNEPNPWQGRLRYAVHESRDGFTAAVRQDLQRPGAAGARVSLFLTHLNETEGCVVLRDERIPADRFLTLPEIRETFDGCYLSASRFSEDVFTPDL